MNDDYKLVDETINGDLEAFEKLIKKYTTLVYNTVYSVTGNNSEIDDIVQEVFIKVFSSIDGFGRRASFKTWLYRITVNKCYDAMRKMKIRRTVPIEGIPLSENPGIDNPTDRAQELLNMLSPENRTIIALKDIEGFSYREISKILKCSTANVKIRLFRARRELTGRYRKNEK